MAGEGRRENTMAVSGWGQKEEHQEGITHGRAARGREHFHSPTGPEWDMCPRVSTARLATSRLRG